MADVKTKRNRKSVHKFIAGVEHDGRRADAQALLALMREVTGEAPAMWGDSIVGFGSYHYKYANGQEGDWPLVGFSPRKTNLSLYIMPGFDRYEDLLGKLGKHKTGKACLYLNKLADVDLKVLRELVWESATHMRKNQGR